MATTIAWADPRPANLDDEGREDKTFNHVPMAGIHHGTPPGNALRATEELIHLDGFRGETEPGQESLRPLRTREAVGRDGPRTDPSGPHARPRRPGEP